MLVHLQETTKSLEARFLKKFSLTLMALTYKKLRGPVWLTIGSLFKTAQKMTLRRKEITSAQCELSDSWQKMTSKELPVTTDQETLSNNLLSFAEALVQAYSFPRTKSKDQEREPFWSSSLDFFLVGFSASGHCAASSEEEISQLNSRTEYT